MEGKERMTRIITFTIILIALTACASSQPKTGLPNPASDYCEQNRYKLKFTQQRMAFIGEI